MNKNDKIFIFLFSLTAMLSLGVFSENLHSVLLRREQTAAPAPEKPAADVSQLKSKLQKAGLAPQEAKYWETIQ